jgi:gamma-glutamyltranspeptidase/glutathione hydrolase
MGRNPLMRRLLAVASVALAVAPVAGSAPAVAPHGPPTSTGRGGAAATVETLATRAAINALKTGGNAMDAAVTAAGVLGVTEPLFCGIGGGGFLVYYKAGKHPHVYALDGRERAPSVMTPTSFTSNGTPLAFNDARFSGLSVGVPGTVRTWDVALRKFGTFTLAKALAPGISVASNGFEIDQSFFDFVNQNRDYFDDIAPTAALYLDPDGTPHDVGTIFRNPDLAKTYRLIARGGAKAFYNTGALPQAIVDTVTHPPVVATANHVFRPGVMTTTDLAAYSAPWRAPTHVRYRGYDVYSMPPPSSGGTTVGEALNILDGLPLSTMTREQALHYFLEASRYAFADRNAYVADPDFVLVPVRGLLSKEFAAQRRALITDKAASGSVPAGDPSPFQGTNVYGEASVTSTRAGTTTHIVTADKKGDAVSYTFTIESAGGSALVVPGYGFLLNNELTDFNYDSTTHPNRVEGGKRPRSSMAPTIVLRKGKPFLVLGSPGGATIITTVLQLLVDRLDLHMSLPQAIADPRASQRNSATTGAEPAFIAGANAAALIARGHKFTDAGEIGAATGIEFLTKGRLLAAAEPVRRGEGSALTVKK